METERRRLHSIRFRVAEEGMSPRSPGLPRTPRTLLLRARGSTPRAHPGRASAAWPSVAAAALGGTLALLFLTAWAVPPLLDWGRFRSALGSIAAVELGRPVAIGGEVTLRLLPEAVLTASDVTLPDGGDGVSATVGALRLQVALLPLLTGRVVPRELVLGQPILRLPWPLPGRLAHPAQPVAPRAFAARIEGGTVRLGSAQVDGINATVHGEPAPPSASTLPSDAGAMGLGAEGFATFAGRSWRFTTALGAPDADGVSAVDLAVLGRGPAARTEAKLRGTLADGTLQGRLEAGGPDMSLLLPQAAPLAWRAEAPFVADTGRVETQAATLSIDGATAEASLVLRLAAPARLDGRLHAASLDDTGWVRPAIQASLRLGQVADLPVRIVVSADTARLAGGTVRDVRGVLTAGGHAGLALSEGRAILPGEAHATLSGAVTAGPDGPRLSGPATLRAPDLLATLAWLRPLAPDLLDAIPRAAAAQATLAGTATLGAGTISLAGLEGEVEGDALRGGIGISLAARPRLGLDLTVDHLVLDDWLDSLPAHPAATFAAVGAAATRADRDVHLRAGTVMWRGQALRDVTLDARTGASGLVMDGLKARLGGVAVSARFAVTPDGTISFGRFDASAGDLVALKTLMPAGLGWTDGLLRGPGLLAASVSGKATALSAALRVEAADAVLEAECHGDAEGRIAGGTLTLRHPGAPRLLTALGVAGTEGWLGTGSFSLRTAFAVRPRALSLDGFDLVAADLHGSGWLQLAFGGSAPALRGELQSDELTLPGGWDAAALAARLRDWDVSMGLRAREVTVDRRVLAGRVSASVDMAAGGAGLLGVSSPDFAGGRLDGRLAFDDGAPAPALAVQARLTDAEIGGTALALALAVDAGRADATLDVTATGAGPAAWRSSLFGRADVALRDVVLAGFDLQRAGAALSQPGQGAQAALQQALTTGQTGQLSGAMSLGFESGRVTVGPGRLTSPSGDVVVAGKADLAAGTGDVALGLAPPGTTPTSPPLGLHVDGPLGEARVGVDLPPPDKTVGGRTDTRAKKARAGSAARHARRPARAGGA